MDFDHDPVRPSRDRRARHRDHFVAQAGAMRRVGDDRQMRQLVHDRNGRQIEEIARRRVEAPHAPLAQNHVVVSFGQ